MRTDGWLSWQPDRESSFCMTLFPTYGLLYIYIHTTSIQVGENVIKKRTWLTTIYADDLRCLRSVFDIVGDFLGKGI